MRPGSAPPRPRAARCLAVWTASTAMTGWLVGWLVPAPGRTASDTSGFVEVLVPGCELAAAVAAGWLWLLVTLVVRDAVRGRVPAGRHAPAALRRAVLAACGLTLTSGLLLPAGAQAVHTDGRGADLLVGLSVPDRMPTTGWVHRVRAQVRRGDGHAAGHPGRHVVVAPGDSLWAIAARTLPPGSDAATVDRRWREIYRANRHVVGPDPHLIRPGQRLSLPPPEH